MALRHKESSFVCIIYFNHSAEPGGRSAFGLDEDDFGDDDDEDVNENDPQLLVGPL